MLCLYLLLLFNQFLILLFGKIIVLSKRKRYKELIIGNFQKPSEVKSPPPAVKTPPQPPPMKQTPPPKAFEESDDIYDEGFSYVVCPL